jgi:hypothetical protein
MRAESKSANSSSVDSAPPVVVGLQRFRLVFIWIALAAITWLLYTLAKNPLLAPSTDVGYYIGVVGASLMLLLMTYPIYKRIRAVRSLGSAKFWFRLHMICGLVGPALIIVHSGLQMRSMNAAWAFWSMVIVAGSGVIGRFLYRGIHRGMHGEMETSQSLSAEVAAASYRVDQWVSRDARLSGDIGNFAKRCGRLASMPPLTAIGALFLPVSRWYLQRRVRNGFAMATMSSAGRVERERVVNKYLLASQRHAQFALFERLFSLWHVAHVPFVVTLFMSTIAHIVAVHLY